MYMLVQLQFNAYNNYSHTVFSIPTFAFVYHLSDLYLCTCISILHLNVNMQQVPSTECIACYNLQLQTDAFVFLYHKNENILECWRLVSKSASRRVNS